MKSLLAWFLDVTIGPRCPLCLERTRGWRTIQTHTWLEHAGDEPT